MITKINLMTTHRSTHRYFHVCEGGLLPDVMHDILGALQYEVKIMLQAMVEDEIDRTELHWS